MIESDDNITRSNCSLVRDNLSISCTNKNQSEYNSTLLTDDNIIYPIEIRIASFVFIFLIMVLDIVGNSLTLVVLYRTPRLRKRPSNMLVANLSITDFLIGCLLTLTLASIFHGTWPLGYFLCSMYSFVYFTLSAMVLNTLTLLSLDRYVAVTRPLRYGSIVSKRLVIAGILVMWMVCIALSSMGSIVGALGYQWKVVTCSVDWQHNRLFSWTVVSLSIHPFVVFSFTYYHIYKTARKHVREIRESRENVTHTSLSISFTSTQFVSDKSELEDTSSQLVAHSWRRDSYTKEFYAGIEENNHNSETSLTMINSLSENSDVISQSIVEGSHCSELSGVRRDERADNYTADNDQTTIDDSLGENSDMASREVADNCHVWLYTQALDVHKYNRTSEYEIASMSNTPGENSEASLQPNTLDFHYIPEKNDSFDDVSSVKDYGYLMNIDESNNNDDEDRDKRRPKSLAFYTGKSRSPSNEPSLYEKGQVGRLRGKSIGLIDAAQHFRPTPTPRQSPASTPTPSTKIDYLSTQLSNMFKNTRKKFKDKVSRTYAKERRSSITILIITGTFVVSWAPYILARLYELVSRRNLSPYVHFVTMWATIISPASNTFVYNWRNQVFRQGLRKLWRQRGETGRRRSIYIPRVMMGRSISETIQTQEIEKISESWSDSGDSDGGTPV